MKIHTIISTIVIAAASLSALSCAQNKARISGRLAGNGGQMVILEQVLTDGALDIDSVSTDKKGNFSMKLDVSDKGPAFYYLRVGSQRIPLFVSAGENISINSQYGNPANYSVTGSPESALIKEFNDMMSAGVLRLDSLSTLWTMSASGTPERKGYLEEYAREYGRIKRDQIKFIIANSNMLASLYALQQRLPNDQQLFNGSNDIVYYRMVADSLTKYHPDSPYLASIRSYIDSVDSNDELAALLRENLNNPASYPEILLPDMYGNEHKLSDSHGKVILLDFWTATTDGASVRNAELKNIYTEYAPMGFEIYQVSLDTSKALWVNTVQEQRLPWISVSDLKGLDSRTARIYNVSSLSANYLIDRHGEIVARDLDMDSIAGQVERLIKQK